MPEEQIPQAKDREKGDNKTLNSSSRQASSQVTYLAVRLLSNMRTALRNDNIRLAGAALIGLVTIQFFPFPWETRLIAWWNIVAFVYLGLTWMIVFRSMVRQTRQWASAQFAPRSPLLDFLLGQRVHLFLVIIVSLIGISAALVLSASKHAPIVNAFQILNALGVIEAWLVLHTSYTLYYAYLYYRSEKVAGGLVFPEKEAPDLLDFAYFAFTLGTAFATSDVKITSRAIRRTVLGHSILSFFYNAAILSVAISFFVG